MTADLPADRDELVRLLADRCTLGWAGLQADEVLASSWLVGVVEAAKREALTEAARGWEKSYGYNMFGVADWLRARAGVGAVPQTTEEPKCEHGRTGPHESAFRVNGVMWRCPGPLGAPLVGEGPDQ